jgi:hypothetical protein
VRTFTTERLAATSANQARAIDYQIDTTSDGRTLKLCNIVDEFTRPALSVIEAQILAEDWRNDYSWWHHKRGHRTKLTIFLSHFLVLGVV